ncbi:MAG: RNA polymerase sigma factor [Luteolibacter sp.]
MNLPPVTVAVESAARDSYSQLLAWLAIRADGDLAGAEDALSEAFLAAIRQWPLEGIPENPNGWLLHTARRKLIDGQRRSHTRAKNHDAISHAIETAFREIDDENEFPDERLKLLFVCAHPAIDPAARAPLMLQTVLGMEAGKIAEVFLTSPAAMSQRLVRAKTKIRDARIPFRIPERLEWNERLGFVLDAVYAAYTAGRNSSEKTGDSLADEALWLARALAYQIPDEPEALGLLALILHHHARREARVVDGIYVPLPEQDTERWDAPMQQEAESILHRASAWKRPGRFQLEAAIQSVHASRPTCGKTHWLAIAALYDLLVHQTPALGAAIGRAIAHAQVSGAEKGLVFLDDLPAASLADHLPYWAARAHLLAEANRTQEALLAFQRSIGLSRDSATREYLLKRVRMLG